MDSLTEALTSFRSSLSGGPAPEREDARRQLSGIQLSLGGGMGTLLGRMEEGAPQRKALLAERVPRRWRR